MHQNIIPKIFVILVALIFSVPAFHSALADQMVRYEKTITLEAAI